jgi:hypothetical protein
LETSPKVNYDSASYLVPPSWSIERFPLIPAINALLRHDHYGFVVLQTIVGVLCWSYLALEALRTTRRPHCYVAFIGVLWISCSDYVTHWYGAILSDSLSLSLLALLLASIASWLTKRGSLIRVAVVAGLWACTRDTNGYVVLIFGVVGLVAVAIRFRTLQGLLSLLIAVGSALAVIAWSYKNGEWTQPFLHVMTDRVFRSKSEIQWFANHGMPVNRKRLAAPGPYLPPSDVLNLEGPAFKSFRAWMFRAGQRTYLEYVLLHPWADLSRAIGGGHEELSRGLMDYYGGTASRPWLPGPVKNLFLSYRQTTLVVGAVITGLFVGVHFRYVRLERRRLLWWTALAASGVLGFVIDWVGDSWEIGRHYVGATVQVAICLLFMASIALGSRPPRRTPNSQAVERCGSQGRPAQSTAQSTDDLLGEGPEAVCASRQLTSDRRSVGAPHTPVALR